jgi:hypothetical protein
LIGGFLALIKSIPGIHDIIVNDEFFISVLTAVNLKLSLWGHYSQIVEKLSNA